MRPMPLTRLSFGQTGIIQWVSGEEDKKSRLMNLGFIPGERISLALISPLGNPRAYRILESTIALRSKDARLIGISIKERT
ncbi:MAG: ferrous iron transport protein A [Clostridia bacterium]|nr:ferrous iron transport protein A [Clostridia bacterium]MBQ4157672.1 ferrous iron transport protein A [Clostridia bacterium]